MILKIRFLHAELTRKKRVSLAENRTQISRLTVGLPNRWKTRDNTVVYGLVILFVI